MGIVVNINGIDSVKRALENLDVNMKKEVSNELNASAIKIDNSAKRLAPVNFGTLRGSIRYERIDSLTYTIEAKAKYAPYVEFGTGGKVNIPKGYEEFAQLFKGAKGGKLKEFVAALMLWIKRKGIGNGKNDKGLAYVIARNILQKGLRPQPFLIPAFEQEKPLLIKRIKELLDVKS